MPLTLALMALAVAPVQAQAALPACRAAQLRLAPHDMGGDLNGMSHAGAGFTLENRGAPCQLPALPRLELRDARGHALPAARKAPVGMHPGPVMLPLRLAHGAKAQGTLRWVSGPVYENNRSLSATSMALNISGQWVTMPLRATLFAPVGQPATFDQSALQLARVAG